MFLQLIVGDFGLSEDQQRVQMGIWAMLAAPLIMSVDLRNVKPFAKELLTNKRVIAVSQDPMGIQARRIWQVEHVDYWMKPVQPNGSYAIAFVNFNTDGVQKKLRLSLKYLQLTDPAGYNITETFTGEFLGVYKPTAYLKAAINPTGIFMATVVPLSK